MNSNNSTNTEKLLYKLILQFAIYIRGSNNELDPHLLNITRNLKQGTDYHKLNPELLKLSKTLAQIPQTAAITALNQSSNLSLQKHFIKRLSALFVETDIPLKLQKQYALLKQKSKANLDEQAYTQLVDSALSLILNIKHHAVDEQKTVEAFLIEISNQLLLLEENVTHASKSNELSLEHRANLSRTIDLQVDNILTSSTDAEELSSLQQYINLNLKELNTHFHKHKDTEDNRQLETQIKLTSLSEKLQDMEVEAESLRNNLKLAHDKALTDTLTRVPNRLAYDERIVLEFNRWQRYKNPLTLIIWDIDLFKLINDNYGHKAGDKTLNLIAQLILSKCRATDFIARFGGEEFVMLLPNTKAEQALIPAEKIRLAIASSGFNYQGKLIKLTISCGISEFSNEDTSEDVFVRADQALYTSKSEGRNKCSILNN
ncbi:MAG: GGDEF domain-containing protein [Methylococcaceae bacterium]